MKTLRPYQQKAKSDTYNSINQGNRCVMLQLATGGGKTFISSSIAGDVLSKDKKVLFIVDGITLSDQTYSAFTQDLGVPVGVIQGNNYELFDAAAPVQVATIQTLRARQKSEGFWEWLDEFGVVFIDEAHVLHTFAKEIMKTVKCPVIGLSATPWAKGLGDHFDDLIIGCPMSQLINDEYLCDYEAYSTGQPNLKGVSLSNGDYNQKEVEHRYDGKLVNKIVETTLKHAKGKQIMLAASTVDQSKQFAKLFCEAGIKAEHIDGYGSSPKEILEKERTMRRFLSKETQMLTNVNRAVKGFDYPEIELLVVCRPTKSLMFWTQLFGRCLRTHPSKDKAIVLDFAGNLEALGRPEDILITKLSKGERIDQANKAVRKDKPCPGQNGGCGFIFKGALCPQCGHDRTPKEGEIEYVDAELVKIDKKALKLQSLKDEFKSGLLYHAEKYNKPDYYANWIYRKKFKEDADFTGVAPAYSEAAFRFATAGMHFKKKYSKKRR